MECALLATMAVALLTGLRILSRPDYLGVFDPAATDALARLVRAVHGLVFGAAFVFLGLGSTVFSYLLLKSRVVPRWLAGLGAWPPRR